MQPALPTAQDAASQLVRVRAGVSQLLFSVCTAVGQPKTLADCERVVSELPSRDLALGDGMVSAVSHGASSLGLTVRQAQVAARDLFAAANDSERLVTAVLTEGGSATWILPKSVTSKRLDVECFNGVGHSRRLVSLPELDAWFQNADEMVPALTFERRLPLDRLVREEDSGVSQGRRAWRSVGRYLSLEARDMRLVVIYAIVIGILSLLAPIAVQALVSSIAFTTLRQPLIVLSILLLGGLGLSGALKALRVYVVEMLQRRVLVRVATDYGRRLPLISHETRKTADLPQHALHYFDVVKLQKAGATLLLDALGLALQTVTGMVLLAFYHPYLLAFDVVLALLLIVVLASSFWEATDTALIESKARYAVAGWLQTIAHGDDQFASASGAAYAEARTDGLVRGYLDSRAAHFRIVMRYVAGGLILQVVMPVALLVLGGILVMERELTLGQLVAAELVVAAIAVGFGKLGNHLEKAFDMVSGMAKVTKILGLPVIPEGRAFGRSDRAPSVRVSGVVCGDVTVAPQSATALSGSSETADMMFDAIQGKRTHSGILALVDSVDVRKLDKGELGDAVWRLDDTPLLPDTILGNLQFGPRAVDVDQARAALERVGFDLNRYPDGLSTAVGQGAPPLPRLDRVRVHVARVLLHRPRVVLIDGLFNDVDLSSAAGKVLADLLLRPERAWTVIVQTRDPLLIDRCEMRVVVPEANHE